MASRADRLGLTARVRVPSEPALRARFTGPQPAGGDLDAAVRSELHRRARSLPGLADAQRTREHWLAQYGEAGITALRATADRLLAGRFDLLGHRDLDFGDPIDWCFDPTTGARTPLGHWSVIPGLAPSVTGDKKVIWELNRLQHVLTLARAYALTGDERYARGVAARLSAWLIANPPGQGINWASSLEVAYRAITWLWALGLTAESHAMRGVFAASFGSLWAHGRHIETYLSTYFSPNTHLSGEALGLVYLGALLPVRDGVRWRALGERILLDCVDLHVRPDGVYFEQSTYYHHYTTEIFTHLWVLSEDGVREKIRAPLGRLLDFLLHAQRPDGRTPLIGDDDGGRVFPAGPARGNDFRPALSTGAVIFERGDMKFAAGELAEETVWLLGPAGVAAFTALPAHEPAHTSNAFPAGGYWIMRDGWTARSNYLIVDCGPHGALRNCGHAHADALSIELCAGGTPALLDAGTFTYTSDPVARDRFRADAHNTLMIDGQTSSAPAGPFAWRTQANGMAQRWWSTERADLFVGEHDGFNRLEPGLRHERSILFLKHEYWLIRDRVRGTRTRHELELRFQCAAGMEVALDGVRAVISERPGESGPPLLVLDTAGRQEWRSAEGAVSAQYGAREPAPLLLLAWSADTPQENIVFALPGDWSDARVDACSVDGGIGARVRGPSGIEDIVLLGAGSASMRSGSVTTDASLLWLRFQNGELAEAIMSGGTFAEVMGAHVFQGQNVSDTVHRSWPDGASDSGQETIDRCAESVV